MHLKTLKILVIIFRKFRDLLHIYNLNIFVVYFVLLSFYYFLLMNVVILVKFYFHIRKVEIK